MIERLRDPAVIAELISVNGSPVVRDRILAIVASAEALLKGHFQLQGGAHSEYLIRFRQIGRDPEVARELAKILVPDHALLGDASVVCPESSGYFLGRAVAELANCTLTVTKIDHSRRPTSSIRSGLPPKAHSRVIVVNDVVTTGASLDPLMDLVASNGAIADRVVVFGALNPGRLQKFANDHSLIEAHGVSGLWPVFSPGDCHLCRGGSEPLPAAEFN